MDIDEKIAVLEEELERVKFKREYSDSWELSSQLSSQQRELEGDIYTLKRQKEEGK